MGSPTINVTAITTTIATAALMKPYSRVTAAPRASSARKAVVPSAVIATRSILQRRAFLAVKRSA